VGHPGAVLKSCADLLALCDCNNFFVSCERLFRPDLEGRPVVVLSSNDGVVISRSNEVKVLGVTVGGSVGGRGADRAWSSPVPAPGNAGKRR